jgi:hypothetical protein
MRKPRQFTLPKISADKIASQLKRTLGLDRAKGVAKYYVKTLGFHPKSQDPIVKVDDVDPTLFTRAEVVKHAHIWTQVDAILSNQKGFTVFELVLCMAMAAIVCAAAFSLYSAVHALGWF